MQIGKRWRHAALGLLVAAATGLAAPAALAWHHDGYRGSSYGYGHDVRSVRYVPVRRAYGYGYGYRPAYDRGYARPYGYRDAPRYYGGYGYGYGYGYRPHHDHWGVGEVIGAMVVGTILTNAIDAAMQPRTRVIERRVVSYPSNASYDPPPTRYVGPDTGYYDRR